MGLHPYVKPTPTSFRVRQTAFALGDRLAYGRLLREAFSTVRFMDNPGSYPKGADFDLVPGESIEACHRRNVAILFDPDWRPKWEKNEQLGIWSMGRIPYPDARFDESGQVYHWGDLGIDSLPGGKLVCRMTPGDKEHQRVVDKMIRLLGKVASKRRLSRVRMPSLEVFVKNDPHADVWVGHEARRWCLEKPNRVLRAGPTTEGYRPMPEVEPKS